MEQKLSRLDLAERRVADLQAALDEIQGLIRTAQHSRDEVRRMMPIVVAVGAALATAGGVWYLLNRRKGR